MPITKEQMNEMFSIDAIQAAKSSQNSEEDAFFKRFAADTLNYFMRCEEPTVPGTFGKLTNPKYKKVEEDLYKISQQIKNLLYKGRKIIGPYAGMRFK